MRKVQERIEWPNGIKGEWEESHACPESSDKDIIAWIRKQNKQNKQDGEYTRYRSILDDSGNDW